LNSIANCNRIGILKGFLGTRQNVEPAQDNATALLAIPMCELIGTTGEGEMHRDPNYMRYGISGWRTLEKIFVPVADLPICGRCTGNARKGEARRQHVFAVACARVLWVERVYQERVVGSNRPAGSDRWEDWGDNHVARCAG